MMTRQSSGHSELDEGRRSLRQSFANVLSTGIVETDTQQNALEADPTLSLVEGSASFSAVSGIFGIEVVEQLPEEQRKSIVASPEGRAVQLLLFVFCALCGAMIPLIQEWCKRTPETFFDESSSMMRKCEGEYLDLPACKAKFHFVPTTAVVAESIFSLTFGLAVTAALSGEQGLRMCVRPERLRMTAPVALFYTSADLVQFLAIAKTDASFFLVVSQVKLLGTAVIAFFVLKAKQTTAQWFLLTSITVTCALYCDLDLHFKDSGKSKVEQKAIEQGNADIITGFGLSMLKVFLAVISSVFTERAFKASGSEPIWVNQVQLKLVSLPCALALLFIQNVMCCDHAKNTCLFSDHGGPLRGWSARNLVLLAAQVGNNFVLGLVYKKINAVAKYLAYAQSLWIGYLINITMIYPGAPFHLDLFMVILILVLQVIAYSFAKATPAPAEAPALKQPLRASRDVELSSTIST